MNQRDEQYSIDILGALCGRTIKGLIVALVIVAILGALAVAGLMISVKRQADLSKEYADLARDYIDLQSEYEQVEVTQEVDTGSGDAFVHGIGDVYYGENQTNSQVLSPESE